MPWPPLQTLGAGQRAGSGAAGVLGHPAAPQGWMGCSCGRGPRRPAPLQGTRAPAGTCSHLSSPLCRPPARCSECAGLGQPGMLNKLQAPSLREDPIPALDSPAGTAGLPRAAFAGAGMRGARTRGAPLPLSPHTGPGMTQRSVSSPAGAYGVAVGRGGAGSDAESHFGGLHVPPHAKTRVALLGTPMAEAGPAVALWGSGMPGGMGMCGVGSGVPHWGPPPPRPALPASPGSRPAPGPGSARSRSPRGTAAPGV